MHIFSKEEELVVELKLSEVNHFKDLKSFIGVQLSNNFLDIDSLILNAQWSNFPKEIIEILTSIDFEKSLPVSTKKSRKQKSLEKQPYYQELVGILNLLIWRDKKFPSMVKFRNYISEDKNSPYYNQKTPSLPSIFRWKTWETYPRDGKVVVEYLKTLITIGNNSSKK